MGRDRVPGLHYVVITADYRKLNEYSPQYTLLTELTEREARAWFNRTYPWLKVYSVRTVPDGELTDKQRTWAQRVWSV